MKSFANFFLAFSIICAFYSCKNEEANVVKQVSKQQNSRDTIIKDEESILKESSRDFKIKKFNQNEIDFIVKEFQKQVAEIGQGQDYGTTKTAIYKDDENVIEIALKGERGYVPSISFEIEPDVWVGGDLDQDGINEILFSTHVGYGGTAMWYELYCLKIDKKGSYSLIKLDAPCPCRNGLSCNEPTGVLVGFNKNIVTLSAQCFAEGDAMCCPSLISNQKYRFQKNQLTIVR
jgi:hypothetical protein